MFRMNGSTKYRRNDGRGVITSYTYADFPSGKCNGSYLKSKYLVIVRTAVVVTAVSTVPSTLQALSHLFFRDYYYSHVLSE